MFLCLNGNVQHGRAKGERLEGAGSSAVRSRSVGGGIQVLEVCSGQRNLLGREQKGFFSTTELLLSEPNRVVLFCGGSEVCMYRVKR